MDSINKIGITTNSLHGAPYLNKLKHIKRTGFNNIMLDHYHNLENEIIAAQNIGLEVESVHIDSRNVNCMWQNKNSASMFIKKLSDEFTVLKRNGVKTAIIHPGQNNHDFSNSAKQPTALALTNWLELIEQAEKHGILVAMENTDLIHLPHLFVILDNIKSANLKFCYDSGHHQLFYPNLDIIKRYQNILHAVHLHDNNLEYPQKTGWSGDLHMVPFDGKINFTKIAEQIANSKYSGSTMLETSHTTSQAYNNLSPYAYLEHAYQAGKKLSQLIITKRENLCIHTQEGKEQ